MDWIEQLGWLSQQFKVIAFYDPVYRLFRVNGGRLVRGQGETFAEAIGDAWVQYVALQGVSKPERPGV